MENFIIFFFCFFIQHKLRFTMHLNIELKSNMNWKFVSILQNIITRWRSHCYELIWNCIFLLNESKMVVILWDWKLAANWWQHSWMCINLGRKIVITSMRLSFRFFSFIQSFDVDEFVYATFQHWKKLDFEMKRQPTQMKYALFMLQFFFLLNQLSWACFQAKLRLERCDLYWTL